MCFGLKTEEEDQQRLARISDQQLSARWTQKQRNGCGGISGKWTSPSIKSRCLLGNFAIIGFRQMSTFRARMSYPMIVATAAREVSWLFHGCTDTIFGWFIFILKNYLERYNQNMYIYFVILFFCPIKNVWTFCMFVSWLSPEKTTSFTCSQH